MVQKFHYYKTDDELKKALQELNKIPDCMLVHYAVKNFVTKKFPAFELSLFSYELKSGRKLWMLVRVNVGNRPYLMIGVDQEAELEYEEFEEAYDAILEQVGCLKELYEENPSQILFVGVEKVYNQYVRYISCKYPNIKHHRESCYFFYSTLKQIEYLKDFDIELPDGYYFDPVNIEKDLQIISDSWQYGKPGEIERTQAKLTYLPCSLIREKATGFPVAYEILDPSGYLNHQYVHPDHRGKGLGKAVEIDLSKKCIEIGIVPNKTQVTNHKMIESSKKCHYWTAWKHDGQEVIWIFGMHP